MKAAVAEQAAMSKPYDAVAKYLVETRPDDWVRWLGLTATSVTLVETDLSTVTAESDRVILVEGKRRGLLHIEFQAAHNPELVERLLRYHGLLLSKFRIPSASIILFLKRSAYRRVFSGRLYVHTLLPDCFTDFGYRVIKVWELSPTQLLRGELSLLPLTPISRVTLSEIPQVIRRVQDRLNQELDSEIAREMITAMGILLGMRYSDKKIIERLLREVREMKESTTYQMILEEGIEQGLERGIEQGIEQGRSREARAILRRIGKRRLGEPTAETVARLEAIDDLNVLERLCEQVFEVETWTELLAE